MDWSNLSQTVLGLVKKAAGSPSFQEGGLSLLKGIGDHILANSDNPERMRRLGETLKSGAPVILGALAKGTPFEHGVPQTILHQVDEVVKE